MEIFLLVLAAVASSTISGLVGMAGGILLLGMMTFVMPMTVLVPVHGVVQLASNVSRCLILRKNIHKTLFLYFLAGAPIGGFMGYYLLSRIVAPEWLLLVVAGLLAYIAFKPKKLPLIHIPFPAYFVLGVIASCLGCLIGATGPFLAPFMIRNDLTKEEIVASKAACQVLIHLVKIPTFLALSFAYGNYKVLIILMVIGVIVGTKIGTSLLKKIDGKQFMGLIKLSCVLMACRLIWKVFF